MVKFLKLSIIILILLAINLSQVSCAGSRDSGDPEYEAQVITIEGLNSDHKDDVSLIEISVAELRKLPQYELDASYKRTTGLTEQFKMSGPYLREVIEHLGGDLLDYAGIGVVGRDGYYCLLSREIIEATPDLMLAVTIDGEAKLDEDNAPARLAVQGQFGPYWVKQVEKIILYTEIPEKKITSVWVFDNLAAGIEPYKYEYYGSKDDAIELEQIFSRLDNVDNRAFFTMKSADGFKKNEVINMVKSRYYIKTEGKDAPTNVSPYIKLGMNVHNIAWISTNADAAIFPRKMIEYLDIVEIEGQKGITLEEVMYETEVKSVKSARFDILGTEGEKITVAGTDLSKGILVPGENGTAAVIWDKSTGYPNIGNLLRIRLVNQQQPTDTNTTQSTGTNAETSEGQENTGNTSVTLNTSPRADTILTITGDGIDKTVYLSMHDLKGIKAAYIEQCFSAVNNYPTKKFLVAKGIDLAYLLEQAGIKKTARSVTVEAADGYKAVLTREQLLGKRYYYPGLLTGSTSNPVEVKPMLAWAFGEGQDINKARNEDNLRLVVGQRGLADVNTAVSVQMVNKITVSTKDNGSWDKPQVTLENGQITLYHDAMDQVKLYYTLDGSEPTQHSQVYNPSTTYFQPDLIKPITVSGSGILKVKVIGYGKNDSEVLSYVY
jgi:DMSO/TMAO reductase YedYZ molybdopterin-dependent catalytic subunit